MAHHQGMAFLVAGLCPAGSADAAALRIRSGVPGHRSAAAGARPQDAVDLSASGRSFRSARSTAGEAQPNIRVFTTPQHADARSPSAFQRPLSRRGHRCRRRLQPLARSGRHALARGRHARLLGNVLLYPRRRAAANSGRPPISRRSSAPSSYEAIYSQGRAEFRRRDGDIDTHVEISVSPEDDIELRRITHHQPRPPPAHDRTDQLCRSRAGPRRRRMPRIRRSAISSCRPRSFATARRFSAPAGRARRRATRHGCST